MGDLLDNGDVDYAVLDVLEGLLKIKGKRMTIWNEYSRQEFMKNNIVKALLDLNIIFKSKYYEEITVEHELYYEVIEKYVKEKKAAMNPHENIRYSLFKKVKGLKFATDFSGVPLSKSFIARNELYPKKSYHWGELTELYFNLPETKENTASSLI